MSTDPEAITARVAEFVRSRGLIRPGRLLVAVSGGQDSLCMLDILHRLAPELRVTLHVAHLDHGFRGAQSRAEAEFVAGLAGEWGIPSTVAAMDVAAYRTRNGLAKQVAARYARYQFVAAAAVAVGADQVAVGHTADDLIETLMMNLMRGSGMAGLRGIAPSRTLTPGQLGPAVEPGDWSTPALPQVESLLPTVVRPVLPLFRAETEGYCEARGLAFRRDPSNQDSAYRRNWVRGDLIPFLETRFPAARERLRSAAELLADDYSLVATAVDDAWSWMAREEGEQVEMDLESWARLDRPLRIHLLRRGVESLAGGTEGLERVHLDAAERLMRQGTVGARMGLPGGLWIEKGYRSLWIARPSGKPAAAAALQEPVQLAVPGMTRFPGVTIEAGLLEVAAGTPRDRFCSGSPLEACLDAARTGPSLVVRTRRPGDRFIPLGMGGPKKLQDFLVDEKVPRGERDSVLLVAAPEEIAWVAGHRIDDRFKVTPETRQLLRLRMRPGHEG